MLQALTRLLKAKDFDVRAFSSAYAFLEGDAASEADCLVLDVGLIGMSGVELVHRMNADGSAVPVIFITGLNTEELRSEAMKAGCVAYLLKPFSASRLLDAIERATP
jgi:FixJ family two-component response regulator